EAAAPSAMQAADAQQSACSYPELRVNRDLLDSKFEGYKLALEQPGIVELKLPRPVDNPQLTERQYSFDHLKAYGVQNHLYLDPWDLDCAYYLDSEWNLMRIRTVTDSCPDPPRPLLTLPNAADRRLLSGRCQPSMAFVDETAACVADGCGRLFLVDTGERGSCGPDDPETEEDWEACDSKPSQATLGAIQPPISTKRRSTRQVGGNSVSMASESAPSPYTWSQSQEDGISVFIPLPTGVGKADIEVTNTGVALRVAIHGRPVLDGPLYEVWDKDACTWTVEPHSECRLLELHLLGKRSSETPWPCLVTNDARGAELPDAATAAAAAVVAGASSGDLYNAQELEDCDLPEAGGDGDGGLETGALVWIDGEAKRVVALTALDSTQWLFATRVTPSEPPYVCLRRDVDGLLWRPDFSGGDASSIWQHVTTFHAFGYVRASKTDAKFVSCAPSFGYAAICDCYRHVYVYHSPRPADTVLRNRQSGRVIAERSTQQVVSLATQDALIGFGCCDSRILVLTERAIYLIRVGPGSD
uniref:NudC domain-containing protein 1 n=1 Tax=Macrostomum lignano TaxID=282301 RepID=A0A1I8HL99_9PLAT